MRPTVNTHRVHTNCKVLYLERQVNPSFCVKKGCHRLSKAVIFSLKCVYFHVTYRERVLFTSPASHNSWIRFQKLTTPNSGTSHNGLFKMLCKKHHGLIHSPVLDGNKYKYTLIFFWSMREEGEGVILCYVISAQTVGGCTVHIPLFPKDWYPLWQQYLQSISHINVWYSSTLRATWPLRGSLRNVLYTEKLEWYLKRRVTAVATIHFTFAQISFSKSGAWPDFT